MRYLDVNKLAQAIESRIEEDLTCHRVGGVSVLVSQNGSVVYKKHFGRDSEAFQQTPDDTTMFRLASMTKPITGVAAMILADRGLLSVDDAVASYLPAFSNPFLLGEDGARIPVSEPITIKHLLTHSSGVGSGLAGQASARKLTNEHRRTIDSYVDFLAGEPLSFVPGTKVEYSGTAAFSVLSAIIEKVSGQPFADFLKREIFDPCGMVDTTFDPTPEQWARMVAMHNRCDGVSGEGKTAAGRVFEQFPPACPLGGAGLVSTLADYSRFAHMLLAGGVHEGHRVLSERSVAMMSSPQISPDIQPNKQRWGLSVRVITSEKYGALPVGAFGWSGAYGTHFWVDPVNRIVAIYMKNSRYDGGSGAVTAAHFEQDVASALTE